jgi:hypothetical protein
MVHRQVDDRILRRRQHLRELAHPPFPCIAAPEVVGPQEAAFEQVLAEPRGFLLIEERGSDLGHHDERTPEHRIVGETNEQRVGLAVLHADVGARQLAQTH